MADLEFLIVARAGSKRIPGKNTRPFAGGASLLERTAAAALALGRGRVYLSTDCDVDLPGVARVQRSKPELYGDHATVLDVVWDYLRPRLDGPPLFVLLPSPFHSVALLAALTERPWCRSLIVRPVDSRLLRAMVPLEGGSLVWLHQEFARTRTQDLPPIYEDAGMGFGGGHRLELWRNCAGERSPLPGSLPVFSAALDIDTPEDWAAAAEKLF